MLGLFKVGQSKKPAWATRRCARALTEHSMEGQVESEGAKYILLERKRCGKGVVERHRVLNRSSTG